MMISGNEDAADIFSRGYYTAGQEYIQFIIDRLRLMIEECDSIDGIVLNHSIGGGTGSGL